MKRFILPVLALVLSFSLAACNGRPSATASAPGNNSKLPSNYENALPPLTQLLVGTFRLEGQEQAVTAEQAQQLAMLWRGYRTVSRSESSSPRELTGLQKQLEDTMTDAQLEAIAAMKLTNEDLTAVMAEQGVTSADSESELSEEQQANLEMLRSAAGRQNSGGGGMPGGGGPGGGGGGMPGGGGGGGMPAGGGGGMPAGDMGGEMGGMPPDQMTGEQGASAPAGGAAMPTALVAKLIALLESK